MNGNVAKRKGRRSGFTLVEAIVAITVLTVMMMFLASIVDMAAKSFRDGRARSDNFSKARASLDVMVRDLESAVFREGVGVFHNQTGVPAFAFYTKRAGITNYAANPASSRDLSLVSYVVDDRVPSNAGFTREVARVGLRRDSLGFTFKEPPELPEFQTEVSEDFQSVPILDLSREGEMNQVIIGPGILSAKIQFIRKDGDMVGIERFFYDFKHPDNPENCVAAVISIIVLDEQTLKALREGGLANLKNKIITASDETSPSGESYDEAAIQAWRQAMEEAKFLPSFPRKGLHTRTYATAWREAMDVPGFFEDLPMRSRSGLKVHQRFVALPLPTL